MPDRIAISAIFTDGRLRPADPAWVEMLAASIEETGLLQPILARRDGNRLLLIDGMHRFEAIKSLGWAELELGQHIVITNKTADEARLAKIDALLLRNDASPLDRALFLFERKAVYERIHPETRGGDRRSEKVSKIKDKSKSPNWRLCLPPRFTAEAAEKVGLSERVIQRSIELASKLSPEAITNIRGTWVAGNQVALLQLAAERPADQIKIAAEVAKGEHKRLIDAKVAMGLSHETVSDPQATCSQRLMSLWALADKRTRAIFLRHIGAEGPANLVPLPKPKKPKAKPVKGS